MKITEISLNGVSNTVSFKIFREGLRGHRVTVTITPEFTGDKYEYLQEEIDRQLVGFKEKPDLAEVFNQAEKCFSLGYVKKETWRLAETPDQEVAVI